MLSVYLDFLQHRTWWFIFSKKIMHFIKTFKFISIKLDAVFSLTLFYLLCSYGYVPRSIPICLFVFSLSLSLLRTSFCILLMRLLLFFPVSFISFYLFNSFLVLSLTLFYNSCLFFFFFLASWIEGFICLFLIFLAS